MKFLHLQIVHLRFIGYSFEVDEKIWYRVLSLFNLILLTLMLVPEFSFIVKNITNVPLISEALCPALTNIMAIVKMLTLFIFKIQFYTFVNEIQLLYDDDDILLKKAYDFEKKVAIFNCVSTFLVGTLYICFPIAISIIDIVNLKNATWAMPFQTTFPYDTKISPNYEFTLLWFGIIILDAMFVSLGIDTLFYSSAFNFGAHFKVLQTKFRNLNSDLGDVDLLKNLSETIQYHSKIIQLCNTLSELYRPILIGQFLLSALQLCVIAIQLTSSIEQYSYVIIYVMFMTAIFFQILIYCHGGTEITINSLNISDALYESEWYLWSPKVRRSILICMLRAQQSIIVKAGFYDATMARFTGTFSAAGSCITLLKSMTD